MANRTGIELLPQVCRIVEVKVGTALFGGGRSPSAGPRIRVFHEIPYSDSNPGSLTAELRQVMKGLQHRAAVAVWGLRSTHQALLLPPAAAPADLEAMARREFRAASGSTPSERLADGIVVGELRDEGRREVGYVSVPAEEMTARLRPLVDAGFVVETAVTPAMAHAALVRQRRASMPEAITVVLSINGRATALTVLRGGLVLFARELPWGHETEQAEQTGAGHAAPSFAARIASEVRRSLIYLKQSHKVDVTHVLVCGDVPEVRVLTGPLIDELGVEVETLDLPEDLDVSRLQGSPERFCSRLGAWRTALALAIDPAPPVNLVPRDVKAPRFTPRLTRRVGAAVAAGLLITAAEWGLVTMLDVNATAERQRLRRLAGALEPELQRQEEERRNAAVAAARQAALRAFASQGPRLARVLEAFSRATPPGIALTGFMVEPGTGFWRITAEGQAEGANAAAAQGAFNQFLKTLNTSPLLGTPITPPSLRLCTEDPTAEPEPATAEPLPPPADAVAQEVEARRPAPSGQAYVEVARNSRLFRIPLRRQTGDLDLERQIDLRRRQQLQTASAGRRLALAAPATGGAIELPRRHPASALDFTLHYEVRK
jgi:Tfp pilus assembly PilM family ATPase